jgi:hypothetical protein
MSDYAVDVRQDPGTGLQYGSVRKKTAEEIAATPKPAAAKASDDAMETGKPLPASQPGSSSATGHDDNKKTTHK